MVSAEQRGRQVPVEGTVSPAAPVVDSGRKVLQQNAAAQIRYGGKPADATPGGKHAGAHEALLNETARQVGKSVPCLEFKLGGKQLAIVRTQPSLQRARRIPPRLHPVVPGQLKR